MEMHDIRTLKCMQNARFAARVYQWFAKTMVLSYCVQLSRCFNSGTECSDFECEEEGEKTYEH